MSTDILAFGEAIWQAGGSIARVVRDTLLETLAKHRSHSRLDRIRCSVCNPDGNPGRLAVNGDEYHRRQKARARRRHG